MDTAGSTPHDPRDKCLFNVVAGPLSACWDLGYQDLWGILRRDDCTNDRHVLSTQRIGFAPIPIANATTAPAVKPEILKS